MFKTLLIKRFQRLVKREDLYKLRSVLVAEGGVSEGQTEISLMLGDAKW